jgi:hypothetical protein
MSEFYLYVRPSASNAIRFAPLAVWNVIPFVLLGSVNYLLGHANRAASFTIAISTAILLAFSAFWYARVFIVGWSPAYPGYEPNLVWIFAPGVSLIVVVSGVVAVLVSRKLSKP